MSEAAPDAPAGPPAPAPDPQGAAAPPSAVERVRRRLALRWVRAATEARTIVLFAAAVRAATAWLDPALVNDAVSLLRAAERLRTDGAAALLQVPHHPLPVAAFALARSTGAPEAAARGMCVLAAAAAVWPLHALARRAAGRHAAAAACILYAVLPKAVAVGATPLSEAFFLPLLLGALAAAAAARDAGRRGARRLVGAGLLCGLGYLARPEALAALPAVLASAALDGRPGKLRRAALVLAGFLLVAAPYAGALSDAHGRFSVSPKKDVVRFAGFEEVAAGSAPSAPATAWSGTAAAFDGALTTPVAALVLVGLLAPGRWRRRRSRRPRLILAGTALVLGALVFRLQAGWGYSGGRHALGAAVLLLPFAGAGLAVVARVLPRVTSQRRFALVAALLLALPLGARAVLRPPGAGGVGARSLGELLAERVDPAEAASPIVVATSGRPLVAWYAERALEPDGLRVEDLPLWGRHVRRVRDAESAREVAADVERALRDGGATWIVLRAAAPEDDPERRLAVALAERGVLGAPPVGAGSDLAAWPIRRR